MTEFFAMLRAGTPVLFLGLAIAAGLMLWLPDAVTSALGLTTFREENRANLGSVARIAAAANLPEDGERTPPG
jgi:hypothetical protein